MVSYNSELPTELFQTETQLLNRYLKSWNITEKVHLNHLGQEEKVSQSCQSDITKKRLKTESGRLLIINIFEYLDE